MKVYCAHWFHTVPVDRCRDVVLAWALQPGAPQCSATQEVILAREIGELHGIDWEGPVEAIEKCYELGWTDGLPVVPPTVERVQEFLDYVQRSGEEVIGSLPERRREVTVGKVAANAVMAGCLPNYLPVVLAATEAMLAPEFNLIGPSSSLGGAAVLAIVNGPGGPGA